ncbi:MAG: hypothetical protein HYZ49_03015 [Chloroflexi bacterium]|nr:hypothetical protein [Chloroflexota bacterium]
MVTNLNVACAVRGCPNPVIGQCGGYNRSCGQYYCATHSADKFCADCVKRRAQDEVVKEYVQIAERVRKDSIKAAYFPLVPLTLIGSIVVGCLPTIVLYPVMSSIAENLQTSHNPALGSIGMLLMSIAYGSCALGICGPLIGSIAQYFKTRRIEQEKAHEVSKSKPGFAEFFQEWRSEKRAEELKKGLAVAGIVAAGALAGMAKEAERSHLKQTVRNAVDDELNRHGL